MLAFADAARPWQSVFSLVGGASATLIGLQFVAVSISAGFFTAERQAGLRNFVSPSVVHFTCALTACLIALAPIADWVLGGLFIAADGMVGVGYAALVLRSMVRHRFHAAIDWEDRLWYLALPTLGHVGIAAAGIVLTMRSGAGCAVLALAIGLLLLVGIRNSWDMTVWSLIRGRQ